MTPEPVRIKLIPNGPIRIEEGEVHLTMTDGSVIEKKAPFSLCRCGQSLKKPFCDGAHKTCGFEG